MSVDGRLRHRRWETDGNKRETFEAIGNIGFVGAPRPKPDAEIPARWREITL